MLRPQFVRSQVSDISLEETHVQNLMTVLDANLDKGTGWSAAVDLQPLFFRLTLDSATEFLFGESVNSQLRREGDATTNAAAFATSFDASQNQLAIAGRYGNNYWIGHTKEFHNDVRICHEFIDYFVQKAINGQRNTSEKAEDNERYVFLEAIAKETSDPVELRSQLINILLAGRDTTASTLGWFFYTMGQAKNRHIYKRLREVIVDEFGTYRNPKPITFEGLKNLSYLQWCVNETLRLYPIVPMNGRSAVKDTVLPLGGGADGRSPILVKKGQDIGYSVSFLQGPHLAASNANSRTGPRHAPSHRPLGRRRRRVPPRAVGEAQARLGLPPVQRRPAHLHRPAVCADGNHVRGGAHAPALRRSRRLDAAG